MANQRLAHLIEQLHITIETADVRPTGSFFPRRYTLVHDGRTLKGEIHADGTITCVEALHTQFVIAQANLPGQKRAKKALTTFLGTEYAACLQAFQGDEAEEMRGQFLDVRPDPPGRENHEREIPFTSLFTDDLTFGMRVVSFNQIVVPTVYVGRIEEVRPTSLGEMAETGRAADVVLLQADRHEQLPDSKDILARRKILDTSSVVTAFPFASTSLSTEPGSLVGVMPNGSLVIVNPISPQLEKEDDTDKTRAIAIRNGSEYDVVLPSYYMRNETKKTESVN